MKPEMCIFERKTAAIYSTIAVRDGIEECYWSRTPVEEILLKLRADGRDVEIIPLGEAAKLRDEHFVTDFSEINEGEFDEMLNVLPPMRWDRMGIEMFALSERYSGSITNFYFHIGERFFMKRDSLFKSNEDLKKELTVYLDLI